jgi:putative inorganic carbon (HCO3(-)) transporter
MTARAPAARRIETPPSSSRSPRSALVPLAALAITIGASLAIGALAAGSPILALFGAFAVLAFLGIAMRPEVAVLLVVGLIYSNAAVVMVQFQGAPFVLAAAVPLILLAPLAYSLLAERRPIVVTPALPWIVLFLVVQLLSSIVAEDVAAAAAAAGAFLLEGLVLYVLITNTIRSTEMIRAVVWVLILVGAALGALSLWQTVTETFTNDYFGFAQNEAAVTGLTETGIARLAGPIGEKNRYAQIMLMLVPLALMQASAERRRLLKIVALACGALAAIAVALTFSRGAALAAGLIVVAMVALRYIRPSHLLAAVLVVGLVLVIVPQYGERLASLADVSALLSEEPAGAETDNSLLSRATENIAALNVFADHPILGVGPEQFPQYYRAYADAVGISVRAADREAHNLYLETAAETGLLGAITFFGAVAVTLIELARARAAALRRHRADLAAMATGFLLAMAAYLATGLFLHLSYARYYWLILALAGVTAYVIRRAMDAPEDGEPEAEALEPAVRAG